MANLKSGEALQIEARCGTLLRELQVIWNEIGESDEEKDKLLLEIEQECLEVYRRKVDQANRSRAQLRQVIAESEAELAAICSAMGERPVHRSQNVSSLKEELKATIPELEEMRKKKSDRLNQFHAVIEQIQKILTEIGSPAEYCSSEMALDESDLSMRKLEELHKQLQSLQKEKADRLKKVIDHLNTLNSLCSVLGIDFKETVNEVHPSLDENEGPKDISNAIIERLHTGINKLQEVKIQRMQKLQDLATTMLELWNLMDTPIEEQQMFQNVTCNIAATEDEITDPNILSVDFINYVEAEVLRLEDQKVSKMKELVLKKKTELEEIRRRTRLVANTNCEIDFTIEAIDTGALDASLVLEQIEAQISAAKEEAFSRKDILEKVEKWLAACNEESWLEEYNRDENRYSAGRGAHLALKRAEKARALVNKLPAMVEALSARIILWEKERGIEFIYDGVPLLSMLEDYTLVRLEKEEERRRQRDQKKLQGQLIAEQEALYGSKPSPAKAQSAKKVPRVSTGGPNRRTSLGGAALQIPKPDLLHSTKPTCSTKKVEDATSTIPTVWRDLDVAGIQSKKLFCVTSTRDPETPRKPFAPLEQVNSIQSPPFRTVNANIPLMPLKPISGDSVPSTPINALQLDDEGENKTPKAVPMPTPKTPMTVSVPMQFAATPAPQCLAYDPATVEPKEAEYSFEERRLTFLLRRERTVGFS